ncbi:MAG: bifunctional phosphoribosyl-AMP cyclohydrolase/phosphoribosyl-ATP diphosphatase HisIE [Duncaniella sp.]|jgi:phosphoribosyl-ATP pyrophosphohydrolase/phosphoribosyl-AMP cyclohydrolase|uniref:bifunctional phosphoribosyl-AMP cyclohydrolase/phosphoribosyl-ATP diphosphatase HisIE n=1 Tax=Duncaniella muricolitica TaxID=2880704 RepID=UPI00244DF513|nr:bifunctional phosphoribosyl-AMP cyclohydrolase/phosphoribosyl-ATP diphosphatase HisIE [Duncaniella muricolitica]MCX4368725.1 bifunctional phosphoribosyl-AMP cyclohydrolase/phosphoribosyl-ATP diphosphatase HisIE [Duncaniella sp.]
MFFSDFNLDKCADRLLPVIVQDATTLRVLMLGYMNREAFDKTVDCGLVTFYSRTRQTLWTKGETSGHHLRVVEMYPDCDMDTLLIKACPVGPTCHRGTTACFDTPAEDGFIRSLSSLIARRHEEMPEDSYTTRLFIKGVKKIAQKVGEEAVESAIEAVDGNRDRFIYEAADLMYHYLVLLEQMGVTLPDIERELVKRHS